MNSEIRKELLSNSDERYKEFHSNLVPNINKEEIIGVRIPVLRKIAKNIAKRADFPEFLHSKKEYYEEKMLGGLILGYAKFNSVEELICEIENFLPYIDNWGICDCCVSGLKQVKKHYDIFYKKCKEWLKSSETYTVRFAIVMLLTYFLDEKFDSEILDEIAEIESEEYYVKMAIAWYFSFALIKQYDTAIKVFWEGKIADIWTHNKAIQKATESYRISDERKVYLRTLKRIK